MRTLKSFFLVVGATVTLTIFGIFLVTTVNAATSFASTLKGRILLQVEQHGEAWYVYPKDLKRYTLGRPEDAYALMRSLGLGVTDADLAKVIAGDAAVIGRVKGYILLQVQQHGEAWYVSPTDGTATYMKDGSAAFAVMRAFGLGITDNDLATIRASGASEAATSAAGDDFAAIARHELALVNAYRVSVGLSALMWNDVVATQAQNHSVDMANGTVPPGHDGFSDRMAAIRPQIVGYGGGGENVAWNFSSSKTYDPAQTALTWWLGSQHHKEAIENSSYSQTGIGVAKSVAGKYFFTQIFINAPASY